MTYLLGLLNSVKLTIIDYSMLVLAAIVGFLVIKLRLQGSALHAAQVALLKTQYDAAMSQQDKNVDDARDAYNQAMAAYNSEAK